MRVIKIKSGGQAYVLENGEECPAGEVCFLQTEWELALRMGRAAATDSTGARDFWGDLLEKKKRIPGYTLFSEVAKDRRAPAEQAPLDFKALGIRPKSQDDRETEREKCLRIARETIEMLNERAKARAKT